VAVRTLVRARFISVLAIVAFALGIGVTTAVFSIFNGVLLRALPYPAVLLVAVLASYLPARTAGRVDPMIVLRDS
jgi:ABC-type lipoprotein release transport system permease subunit